MTAEEIRAQIKIWAVSWQLRPMFAQDSRFGVA
jgi:hypothetical protein